jgi:hypothetical protein
MSAELVCLTLVSARSLRDELFDYLGEQRDLASGFTASDVAGHGPDVRLQTSAERVKGHANELMVRTILPAQDAARLLERLKTAFAGSRMIYWIMPVFEFGVIDNPQARHEGKAIGDKAIDSSTAGDRA